MRIALVLSRFPVLTETFIVRKFRGLLERGYDIHVVCNDSNLEDSKRIPQFDTALRPSVHVTWPHRPRWLAVLLTPLSIVRGLIHNASGTIRYLSKGFKMFGWDVLRRFYLDSELVILKPSIIHFEFGALAVNRSYLSTLLGAKMIVSFRGYDINRMGLQNSQYYHDIWRKADGIHFLGNGLWKRAIERGCPEEKFHTIIPPAIDADYFAKFQKSYPAESNQPLRILSIGRLEWEKGYQYALQAVQLLRAKGVPCEYHIVGGGSNFESVSLAITQLGLRDCTVLLDAQPHERVVEEMLWADVLLHSAVSEGFCNAVLEAQAIGLPVVSSDAGGLPENVSEGETGFVVPRRNAAALAEKLALLARDRSLREKMGIAGRKRAFERFLLKDQISAFVNLYEQVGNSSSSEVSVLQNAPAQNI